MDTVYRPRITNMVTVQNYEEQKKKWDTIINSSC
jgi:hypothetical protein